jgi:hypothetical protein
MVKPEHLKVFEMAPWVPSVDLQRGLEHIQSTWGME